MPICRSEKSKSIRKFSPETGTRKEKENAEIQGAYFEHFNFHKLILATCENCCQVFSFVLLYGTILVLADTKE
ncbi:hypothetical protein Pint_32997 [Pistacia integerrima]|uniref:Uncharacterized protein n=1 Tax=Pistacia integerrima TaxID=434235 RepID=A0ACC0X974_9ROSI|nr:hypothetical protein Pint_32997 [Pistacia integerrima]